MNFFSYSVDIADSGSEIVFHVLDAENRGVTYGAKNFYITLYPFYWKYAVKGPAIESCILNEFELWWFPLSSWIRVLSPQR
jgi:hypothetical protein